MKLRGHRRVAATHPRAIQLPTSTRTPRQRDRFFECCQWIYVGGLQKQKGESRNRRRWEGRYYETDRLYSVLSVLTWYLTRTDHFI
ncbi:hypothetical protein HYPSUDRAFT_39939 [Hypholoma sublateritium FD-334 SS-4]|uniref:Uncharacterized protein n=1 Tax=Hypholoma sublateritium (strain FD-334 SS-4) TaxID=945553 RepID=A0A0D2L8D3_HYPSF|nr:hypothetical protein HYPSUDRAFT_39939 [Hypholoma sublateritium FD-334 SS-4]